jgi:hypothetical protein
VAAVSAPMDLSMGVAPKNCIEAVLSPFKLLCNHISVQQALPRDQHPP